MDREKVIKGLECLAQKQAPTANPCKDCGYINRPSFAICVKDIASDALELLKEQPQIVRCKDCKNSGLDSSGFNGYWCLVHTEWHDADWFCAYGEREEL